jgi:hypothetical protein
MSECDEVAATMFARVIELGGLFWSLDNFRNYVRVQMRDVAVATPDRTIPIKAAKQILATNRRARS